MSQPSVVSYFNSRKRHAVNEISTSKSKIYITDKKDISNDSVLSHFGLIEQKSNSDKKLEFEEIGSYRNKSNNFKISEQIITDKIEQIPKSNNKKNKKIGVEYKNNGIAKFYKKGFLSPKHLPPIKNNITTLLSKNQNGENVNNFREVLKKELCFDEIKLKITRNQKLEGLKESINRIQELEKARKFCEEQNNRFNINRAFINKYEHTVSLREFKAIDLEILTSPVKGLKTPIKRAQVSKTYANDLMSPKTSPKRLIFSPQKDFSCDEIYTVPANEKYLHLSKLPTLSLPSKYKNLVEIFKAIDNVCAMLFNRKECITFKKLKVTVQRIIRKNLYESHLAQIKNIYPDAFLFYQSKMRNYGSISKDEYFQLVIKPNFTYVTDLKTFVKDDNITENERSNVMNFQMLVERYSKFQHILLEKVMIEHAKFLKSLEPPLLIPKEEIKRWHPEFDLETCPEIEKSNLPQPPNIEKFSSARDILSTARNLFNSNEYQSNNEHNSKSIDINVICASPSTQPNVNMGTSLLKNVPQSLLMKIRSKQSEKARSAIIRKPSQDVEAAKYSRLPDIARHIRNVFITERKAVLSLEVVINKIENSYKTSLTSKEIELHLKLIAKQCPNWIQFHIIRKTTYLKMQKDFDLSKVITHLEKVAKAKV